MRNNKKTRLNYDFKIFGPVFFLIIFGLLLIYSASSYRAVHLFDNSLYFVQKQIIFCVLGLGLMLLAKKIPNAFYHKIATPLLIISYCLLVLSSFLEDIPLHWDITEYLYWCGLHFPISQIAVFSIALYIAHSMEKKGPSMKSFSKGPLPHLAIACAFTLFMIVQHKFGTALMITALVVILLVFGGAKLFHLLLGLLLYAGIASLTIIHFLSSYEYQRFLLSLNPWYEYKYHSFGSVNIRTLLIPKSIFGVGLGQEKNKLIYYNELDPYNILMVISEELGWLGVISITLIYTSLVLRGIQISVNSHEAFQRYLALGMASIFGIYSLGYLFAHKGFAVTIPLIGYGGSSLMIMLFCIGILLNISSQNDHYINRSIAGSALENRI